jgi:hypothetical protein
VTDVDLAQTILEIEQLGEHMQRMGDTYHSQGLNEKAKTCYSRAKVAREEKLLLWTPAEATDPEFSMANQRLLASADLYHLVRWAAYTPPEL